MEFKNLIRQRRLYLHMTLEEIGNKVGVSKATVLRWETGEIKNIGRDKIIKLSNALEITPEYLLGLDANSTDIENSNQLNHNEKELLKYFRLLPDEDCKKFIIKVIKSLLKDDDLCMKKIKE